MSDERIPRCQKCGVVVELKRNGKTRRHPVAQGAQRSSKIGRVTRGQHGVARSRVASCRVQSLDAYQCPGSNRLPRWEEP